MPHSSNFEFLKEHDAIFFQLTNNAERIFAIDPNACLMKLRQFGEALAQDLATQVGLMRNERESQLELLNKLRYKLDLDRTISELFHVLRTSGNSASHGFVTSYKDAMDGIRVARELAIWYHRSFGKKGDAFKPGPFVLPEDPSANLRNLQNEIAKLKTALEESEQSVEENAELAALKALEAEQQKELADKREEDAKTFEELYYEQESELKASQSEFEEKIKALTEDTERLKREKESLQSVRQNTRKASSKIQLNEAETRQLIDKQLQDAGWITDTQAITFKNGARPEKGINKAIAEWPTSPIEKGGKSGRADYVLFAGLIPIAIVEAKKENQDVSAMIPQAERYSKGFKQQPKFIPAWKKEGRAIAWPYEGSIDTAGHYQIPFVYSCNGRPYVKQYAEKSGTWFRDVRHGSYLAKALQAFHSPVGLLDKLLRSKEDAEVKLKQEGFGYLGLRSYQEDAIKAVEAALEQNSQQALLAMATGTGKTRTVLGLIYRFLKTERFNRILFLVDRSALGSQAFDTFTEVKLEQNQALTQIYNVADLGDMRAEAETRVHVATVQAMVQRVFDNDNPISVDEYDCIIVDEAHRGYTLDQEMGEGEALVRDSAQYLSSYRRVIDYFDAFKVGLTATPAAHTTDIFGRPVYTYSYREAVADDWLIDHEPPIKYDTQLNSNGITLEEGDEVSVIDRDTGQLDLEVLEDELNFEVESFNRKVITPAFDKVIAQAFAKEFDPSGDEKAMVFCVSQPHAEAFKNKLDLAFKAIWEEDYNSDAVQVITGKTDQVSKVLARYKNERYPSVAITVDLLTTGIDVPKICHLLFMRRVKSRILYEQMIGRATRRCDDIGKTAFYIHDAVGLYDTLQAVNTMKPLVKDPNIQLGQLIDELHNPASFDAPGSQEDSSHAHDVLDQISQKVMRVLRKAENKAQSKPAVREKLDELQDLWGVEPAKLHKHLHEMGPQQAQTFLSQHMNLVNQLEQVKVLIGSANRPVLYEGKDELLGVSQGYGVAEKPADYLDSFVEFVKQQMNQNIALKVVCNKPKELTREQLKEIRLLLDSAGYSETNLKSAWRQQTNQDIAASILGHIRRAALGEALVPFEQRVQHAMDRIYQQHPWSRNQIKWLDRLAKQLVHEVIVDEQFINKRFADEGGINRFKRVLDNKLGDVLDELKEHLWDAM
ncbi:MAG: type I restriction-modification system endonuclease [Colwellia sp.]